MSGCLEWKITDTGKCKEQNKRKKKNRDGGYNWDWGRRIMKNE